MVFIVVNSGYKPTRIWEYDVNDVWLVVTGTWLDYDFPFSWECHHPNWRTHIVRGVETTNQLNITQNNMITNW